MVTLIREEMDQMPFIQLFHRNVLNCSMSEKTKNMQFAGTNVDMRPEMLFDWRRPGPWPLHDLYGSLCRSTEGVTVSAASKSGKESQVYFQ